MKGFDHHSSFPGPPAPDADAQAAEWLVRRDRGLTAVEQDEFFQWLAADPRHGECFSRHQRTWKEFNLLAQWRPEHSAEPNPDLLAVASRPRSDAKRRRAGGIRLPAWPRMLAAMAAAAVVVIGVFLVRSGFRAAEEVPPGAIAYEQRVLEDGSTIEIRGTSEVSIAFSEGERRVTLGRGEAFFTVAKDAARPFIVHANGIDVRAIGTAFNVKLGPDRVEVLVTEGQVGVRRSDATGEQGGAAAALHVGAGQRASLPIKPTAAAPAVVAVTDDDIARALAWQPQLLDFNSTPLRDVVAEFNSRNVVQLEIEDDSLAGMPIVASFRSDNVEGFVRLLEANGVAHVERSGNRLTLRKAAR